MKQLENLIKKVRSRVAAFVLNPATSPKIIVKIAKICGVKIPEEVNKQYGSEEP